MADAIEEMGKAVTFLRLPSLDSQLITIRACLLGLASGDVTTSIALTIPDNKFDGIFAFVLPACMNFHAKSTIGMHKYYAAVDLNGATVEPDGADVQLTDDTWIHAIEFTPMQSMPTFTPSRSRIVRQVIFALNAEDRCIRPVISSLPDTVMSSLYATAALDFAAIQREQLPPLNEIERLIFDDMPDVTRSALSDALAAAGMRRPRSGPKSTRAAQPDEP